MGSTRSGLWSVGELARACGVSVRTLHHYDDIGLLSASGRTPSGHRRYGEADVRRLYRIRALQMLGIPLAGIGEALGGSGDDDLASMRSLLDRQLRHVQQHAQQIQALQDRLDDLLERLDAPVMPTPEQLGVERIEEAKRQWEALVNEGLLLVGAGTPVSDPAVQEWVRSWEETGSMFHSGEDTKVAARAAWQENQQAISSDLPWSSEDLAGLMAYLQKARAQ
ncbi:MerR family transcriptional regulator [Arthrobacter sp. yr096]|uniref:MerR family transcriptional regulator n=1 Tax=Arthrobacter sp. yr096 TaxID=1761750 RepID=UPI000B835488|nr:MerR family transcriptional regulator [Arthrobacter sp. yr096]